MSRKLRSYGLFVVALVAAVLLPGCLKAKQVVTIMPDGSGKIETRMGFNAKLLKDTMETLFGGMGGPPGMGRGGRGGPGGTSDPTDVDLAELEGEFEGIAAFTVPEHEDGVDGWEYLTFTAYFDDINAVKRKKEDRRGATSDTFSATFLKTDSGYELSMNSGLGIQGGPPAGGPGSPDDAPPEMREKLKGLIAILTKDLSVDYVVKMPGEITEAEGLPTKDGRTASLHLSKDDLKEAPDGKKITEVKKFRVICGPATMGPDEVTSFKEEMAKAKADWAALKAKAGKSDGDDGDEEGADDGEK